MCDCFHLAFPNWHASATGNGHRLKGPEQDTEDDLVCEEPEVLEEERPRPQGSSPVEEFPTTEKYVKQAEGDFYDSPNKSSKKGKRIGFGSLFDKRSSAKMNQAEEMQNDGSEMIVKTVKEGCAEGLVVSGGGKDGIFIKEVKPESPASKHLSVKEGDQILSATVYFDNVSYEDALQILEHAQPYKVEFCLKRKPAPTRTQEDAEMMRPEVTIGEEAVGEEGTRPEMRGRRKAKKQHDRISWPKFPTFSKGRRAKFKRSHSTSEAEEQRKLEISPATSDTESPIKSPLKSPDDKDKKKMHKMKYKMKMSGRRSKSVEETQENEGELPTDNIEVLNSQNMNIVEEHSFQESVTNLVEIPKMDKADNTESIKTKNEFTCPTVPVTDSLHKAELISLNNTLKTTDITVALGEESRERSELKVSLQGKDKSEIGTDSQLKSFPSGMRTSDPSTIDNIMGSPNQISQEEAVEHQVDSDIILINKDIFETDIPKINVSHDMLDVGLKTKSPSIESDKEKKERKILETESYGIRTRGPLADIAISSHFANTLNRLEFIPSDTFTFDIKTGQDVSSTFTDTRKPSTLTPVISQPKPKALDVDRSGNIPSSSAEDIKILHLKVETSELTQKANTDAILGDLGKIPESKFKLPKVGLSEFDKQESITISQRFPSKAPLIKREEIEIPGREDKGSKANFQAPKIKEPKIEKIIKISKAGQARGEAEEFNVEDVKEAVSKFPAFKLPERDITGVLVQREVTIMEKKTGLTPRGSPCKISSMSTEISIKPIDKTDKVKQKSSSIVTKDEVIMLPKTELQFHDEIDITENKTDQSKTKVKTQHAKPGKMFARDDKISTSPDVKFKLPKREDIEIPGMEAIEESVQLQKVKVAKETDTQDKAVKDSTVTDVTEKTKIKTVRKGHEKKSKKGKVSMPSFEIKKPDIRFPDIGIELPKKATSSKIDSDEMKEINAETKMYLTEQEAIKQTLEKSQTSKHEIKRIGNIEGEHDVYTAIVKETPTSEVTQQMKSVIEGELKITAYEPSLAKSEITSKDKHTDASPHKIKLPKLKIPKIGGVYIKGTPEVPTKDDVTLQENDIIEVVLDSEKRMSETDKGQSLETDKNLSKIKMPSIDVSLPKVKLTKTEGKSKQEETGLTKSETDASVGFSKDQVHSELTGPTKEEVEAVDIYVPAADEETEGEAQAEIKDTESKVKKRKISFPKFGFSKSDIKVSDADVSISTVQSSSQEGCADVTGIDGEIKTTEVEAGLKDSTVSPTKFKLPTIKLPKFGVSFSKATDGRMDIPMPDVSTEEATMDVKLPRETGELTAIPDIKGTEISLSVSKPEVEFPEEKAEIKGFKTAKSVSLTDHEVTGEVTVVELSKPDIKDVEADVSFPHGDFSTSEGKMEIKEPNVSFNISKDETEQRDLTGSASLKFKLPSINLPKFGVKTSKVVKDMPMVDIDAEEPDVKIPEAEISINLKDDAPLGDIKESHVTTEGHYEGYSMDMNIQDVKTKEQEGMFKLPKFGISLSGVKESDTEFSKLKTDGDISLVAEKTEVQIYCDETLDKPDGDSEGSEFKMKRPSFSLPKFGFTKIDDKASEADLSLHKIDASKPAGSIDKEESIKEANESEQAEQVLKGSPTKFKLPTIRFPKFGVSLPKTTGADLDNQMLEITEDKSAMEIKLPETELSGEFPSLSKMESANISLSLSKPEVDVSTPEARKIDNAHYEIKVLSPEHAFSKPEFKTDHGLAKEPAIADSITSMDVQGKKFDTEFKPTSVTEDTDIPKAKEKESETTSKKLKISFPKFGFSKTETKIPDVDTSVQKEGISVPETEVKETEVEIPAPELEVQLKTKSTTGSPSKFKLPTISLPKFDISVSKTVEEPSAKADDVVKSEIKATSAALSLNDSEISKDIAPKDKEPSKLHFESIPKDAEIKPKEIDPGSHGSRFMTTKFEISFPKLKRPESKKVSLRTVDNVEKPEGTHDMERQSVDVKETEEKMKKPKVLSSDHGLSKQDNKAPEFKAERHDLSMTTGEVDVKQLESDIKVQTTTTGGSPIKFKLPTFKLPKFGISAPKVKPEVSGEAHPLEAEVVLTSVEMSDGKSDFTVPNQDLIKPIDLDQPKVDTADMSLPEVKRGKLELLEAEAPQFDSQVPGTKTTKTGFSLPKLGFSKPEIKISETDASFQEADTSKPEGDVEIKEQSKTITVLKDEVEPKDQTTISGSTKFKLPSINFPKIGGKATKDEKAMSVDTEVKGTEASYPDTQIKTSTEPPSVNIKEPHLVIGGQTVTVDLNVEDTELEVQGGKLKLPKFGIGLPKVKGFDLTTSKSVVKAEANLEVQETDIKEPEIIEGKTHTMEFDSTGLDVKMKTLPKSVFSKPEMKASEIGVSVQKPDVSIPEGSVDITEANVDIKMSDPKESTIFGSPTKFKLPSINFPKFGVKSQKVDLEIETKNKKSDSSQPEAKLEVHPSSFETQDDNTKSADIHEADSKGMEVKVKRPSFSFPKFGFSKPDFTTPELDASVQKIDASIPESNVHVTEQTAEVILPKVEIEAEQKDLTMTGSPTKFKLPTVNLPIFGVKTSKGTVSSEISVPEPEIQVSAQTPTTEIEMKEKEINISATKGETDIHLAEKKIILPDAEIPDISIKGKADIPGVGLDVKLKKPSFSLPKFGFSKPDIKSQEADTDQPKIDMCMVEGNISVKKQDAEITFPDFADEQEDPTVSQTKFKMPSINLPKFGIKYSKATVDIPTVDVDIKESEVSIPETGEIQTIDIKTNMDIKGSSANVDVKSKETDFDGLGSKFKLPKLGIGMQKVKETEMQSKETKTVTVLLSEKHVQQPDYSIEDVTIKEKDHNIEIDSKGLKVKLPKMGLSKPELNTPEADLSLPKADLGTSMKIADVSEQSENPEKETDVKNDTLIGSPTKFKLPTINFPKFGIRASKVTVDIPTANVDIKGPEVSLPDENLKLSAEVPTVDIKGPKVNVENASTEMNIEDQQEVKFKIPKFGIALPKVKGPDSEIFAETEGKISGNVSIEINEPTLYKESVEMDKEARVSKPEAEQSQFKLPKLGISLQKSKTPEIDVHISKAEGSHIETKEAKPSTADVVVEGPADLADISSKGLHVKMKKPSFTFPKIGLSKSDGKAQDIQSSETATDLSLPEGSAEFGESERNIKSPEGNIEITSPQFGSPTKFKLPTIKLPKFGVSTSKVTGDATKADIDITDVKVSSVDIEVQTPKMDPLDDIKVKTVEIETTPVNIKAKGINQEGQENKFKLPKFAISLPKVKGLEVGVPAKEIKTGEPEIGITELKIKTPAEDANLRRVDIALPEGSANIQKAEAETELKDGKTVTGSPSKFKLPTFKMPKFGISAQKTSDIKAEVAEVDMPDIKTAIKVEDKPIKVSKDLHIEYEIKEATDQATEVAFKKKDEGKGSPSKFKLPTIKMPKISISRTKSQDEEETTMKVSAPDIKTEPKDDIQGPKIGDVFKGFDVEFNDPTIEEMEAQKDKPSVKQDSEPAVKAEESSEHKDKGSQDKSKFKFKFPKLGFSQSSDESDKLVDAKAEEGEKHFEAPADQTTEGDKEHTKTEKGGWFKFSKFSSPTKTAKIGEKEIIQPPEEAEKGSVNDDVEKESDKANEEPGKSPLSEVVEENISPTLSLRSSEAFADISSTLTTEQTGPSQTSPTRVKVKYAEPTATIEVNDTTIQRDVVTSTARCELITMEPHQPEKVNIPFSSDTSSPSVDTLKQMSGEIHVFTTNIQAIPDTQQPAILTNLDAHGIHTSPLEVTLRSDSVLTVEETRLQSAKHTLVERHVVKETLGDDKETILVTHTTRVFEGDSAEPISDETASSIRRLRDTVHTEKMRFFDSVATFEEVTVTSSEISLRHMDSSTDENGGDVHKKAEL